MKNFIFLGIVLFIVTFLFTLRYAIGLFDDNIMKIALLTLLVLVLIARKKLGITFFEK